MKDNAKAMAAPIRKCVRCNATIKPGEFSALAAGVSGGVWDEKCFTFMTGIDATGNYIAHRLGVDALKAALRLKEAEAADAERQRKTEQGDIIIANIDALLLLVPEHDRTSCSDEAPSNAGRGRCTRCALLAAEREGDWRNDLNLRVTVEYDDKHATFPDTGASFSYFK